MKKICFRTFSIFIIIGLSCRQQEEMMDSEDLKSLSVLQEAKSKSKCF